MSQINSANPKPHQTHLHTAHILFATLASVISVVGGVYSLKSNFFQPKASYGELAGVVRDERLARPLRLAALEIYDSGEGLVSASSTDDDGVYTLKNLKEGKYRVKASASLHEEQIKNVHIQEGRTSTIDFNLAPIEENPLPAFQPAPAPKYEADYYPDSPPEYRPRYDPNLPTDETVTQRQPSGSELLIKTGAVLVQQMLERKRRERTNSDQTQQSF